MMETQQPAASTPIEALRNHFITQIAQAEGAEELKDIMANVYDVASAAIDGHKQNTDNTRSSDTTRDTRLGSGAGVHERQGSELEDFTKPVGKLAVIFAILGVDTDSLPKLNADIGR
jgi:hypothetical protein